MIVTTASLYKLAYGRYAVGAYNISVSVEAELGQLGGVEEDIQVDEGHASLICL